VLGTITCSNRQTFSDSSRCFGVEVVIYLPWTTYCND
jgi:hypothetical protein